MGGNEFEPMGCTPRGPVGIEEEDKPRPGEVVAVVTPAVGRDCLCGSDLAEVAPVGSTGVEGTSASRGESHCQGRSVVGRIAARGAAAAWLWSLPLGCLGLGKNKREREKCRKTRSRARRGRDAVDERGDVPCYGMEGSKSSNMGGGECTMMRCSIY